MKSALKAEFRIMHTSEYIADEPLTPVLARTRNHQVAVNTEKYILSWPRIETMPVSKEEFKQAWNKFQKFSDRNLSFTDCTSLALMEAHGIERIMSFDAGFDVEAKRIC